MSDCANGFRSSVVSAAASIVLLTWAGVPAWALQPERVIDQPALQALIDKASRSGTVAVVVTLRLPEQFVAEAQMADRSAIERQRGSITRTREALLASLGNGRATQTAAWVTLPLVALTGDAAALRSLAASSLVGAINENSASASVSSEGRAEVERLTAKVTKTGTVSIIVGLNLPIAYAPEAQLRDPETVDVQRATIAHMRDELLARLSSPNVVEYRKWERLPYLALRVNAAGLRALSESPLIKTIREDGLSKPQ